MNKSNITESMRKSFSKNPNEKGSYLRRLQDIERGLSELGINRISPTGQFIYLIAACEKLAKIMYGASGGRDSKTIFHHTHVLSLPATKHFCKVRKVIITEAELEFIFGNNAQSAKSLRNSLLHEIGPTNARNISKKSDSLCKVMRKFLKSRAIIEEYILQRPEA
jgi:hypothetical protein